MDSRSESQAQEADNVEHEEDGYTENGESSDQEFFQHYQMRPKLEDKFKPQTAKEVIHNVLFDQLSTKVYNAKEAPSWCKEISTVIRNKIKDLEVNKYKFVVHVAIGAKDGSGVKMGTRCIWDAEADSYAHDKFINDSLFCVATVYAVYHY